MESGSVYIIGGTIGGDSSGWWTAIIAAALTAGLTSLGLWWVEQNKRQHERRTLAASFRAEMELFVKWLRDDQSEQKLVTMCDLLRTLPAGAQKLPSHTEKAGAPRTVYDASLDRIGILGTSVAIDLVRFYGIRNGVRGMAARAVGDFPPEVRIAALNTLLEQRPAALKQAEALIDALGVADAPKWRLFNLK